MPPSPRRVVIEEESPPITPPTTPPTTSSDEDTHATRRAIRAQIEAASAARNARQSTSRGTPPTPAPSSQRRQVPPPSGQNMPSTPEVPSGPQPNGRDTRRPTTVSSAEESQIRQAFSTEDVATNFLAIFGANTSLVTRVNNIGCRVAAYAAAATHLAQLRAEMEHYYADLERRLPTRSALDDIRRTLGTTDPVRGFQPPTVSHEDAGRRLPSTTRPTPARIDTRAGPVAAGQRQPTTVAGPHASQRDAPAPPPYRVVENTAAPVRPRQVVRHGVCDLCRRLVHSRTQCSMYWCKWCDRAAPGHSAKFCGRNLYSGWPRWSIPPRALELAFNELVHQ